jgi:hypothetical protein
VLWFFKCLSIQAKQHRNHLISIICCLLYHLTFLWNFLTYALLIHFFQYLVKTSSYRTLLVHAKRATIGTNMKLLTHVSCVVYQMCLLSHEVMVSHNIETVSLILSMPLSFAWIFCLHNILVQQYTFFVLHLNMLWNTVKFTFLSKICYIFVRWIKYAPLIQHLMNLLDL